MASFESELKKLKALVQGLPARSAVVRLFLDRPAPIRRPAAASIRGLAGTALMEQAPEIFHRWFKPDPSGHVAPAYVFEGVQASFEVQEHADFILTTWDPADELRPALAECLERAVGAPFGESGARVAGSAWSRAEDPRAEVPDRSSRIDRAGIELTSPVRVKADNRWIGERELGARHLTLAAARRLNQLSATYGNGEPLDPEPFLRRADEMEETDRRLRWIRPRRRSATQGADLCLSGVVGEIGWAAAESGWAALMGAAAAFHIGARAADGCGCFRLFRIDAS